MNGKVPSYLGTSASFVAAVTVIRAQGGDSADVTGAILVAGVILALVGDQVHFGGARYVRAVLPPAVTGAVVMLIGFNLARVATSIYFPSDQWIALLKTAFLIAVAVLGRGFFSRIAVFLALVFGYLASWVADRFSTVQACNAAAQCIASPGAGFKRSLDRAAQDHLEPDVRDADRAAPAGVQAHLHPARHPVGHRPAGRELRARQGSLGDDRRRPGPYLGRAFIGDGFGAIVAATPGGVLGGITLVLYGMIGLLGAKIWIENRLSFADPVNLVPLAGGIIAGIGDLAIKFTSTFSITGIAAGTLIVILGYHGVKVFRREGVLAEPAAEGRAYEGGAMISTGNIETPEGEVSPFSEDEGEQR